MSETTSRTKNRWLVAAAVVIAVGVGIGVGTAIAGGDDSSDVSSSQQLAGWRQACQQWNDDYSRDGSGPGTGWCHAMTDWMYDQMRDGTMGPSMMWGDPQRMRDTCRQWARSDADASGTDAMTWCAQMVTWMTDHMGNWDGWDNGDWDNWMHGPMMNGSMMGR
jgi:hypothetical protein